MNSLEAVARRLVWWKLPQSVVGDHRQLLARAMSYGTLSDLQVLLKGSERRALADVLEHAPPGVFDRRSWRYWHLYLGRPVPPMPIRILGRERNRSA